MPSAPAGSGRTRPPRPHRSHPSGGGSGSRSPWCSARWSSIPRVSTAVRVHTLYVRTPPGASSPAAASTIVRCTVASRPGASRSTLHRASGRRRRTPSPEHGASTSTPSNDPCRSGGADASATTTASPAAPVPRRVAHHQPGARRRHVAGHHPHVPGGGQGRGLPPGGRAQVGHQGGALRRAARWQRVQHRRGHPLRGRVLHVPVGPHVGERRLVHGGQGPQGPVPAQVLGQPTEHPVGVRQGRGVVRVTPPGPPRRGAARRSPGPGAAWGAAPTVADTAA